MKGDMTPMMPPCSGISQLHLTFGWPAWYARDPGCNSCLSSMTDLSAGCSSVSDYQGRLPHETQHI